MYGGASLHVCIHGEPFLHALGCKSACPVQTERLRCAGQLCVHARSVACILRVWHAAWPPVA